MKLSVIIPTHNRATILEATLSALGAQLGDRDDCEVIVVDDGSDASTRRRLNQLGKTFDFALLEKEQGGLASARNLGADRARGEILYFLDDDVIPGPETVQQHLSSHQAAAHAVAVLGSLPYPETVKLDTFLWYLARTTHYDLYKDPKKYPQGRPPLPPLNGNSSVARTVFFDVGAYDEAFRQYGGEDLELGYRLARHGVEFVYNPRAIGFHNHIKSFAQFCGDQERAGESLIRVYRKYPEIKAPKKIDVLEDPIWSLPGRKKVVKLIMSLTLRFPWVLALPRAAIALGRPCLPLRHVLLPLYRWIGHYHYAVGMRRGLAS
jgi:GT2 family glycosyltransferase